GQDDPGILPDDDRGARLRVQPEVEPRSRHELRRRRRRRVAPRAAPQGGGRHGRGRRTSRSLEAHALRLAQGEQGRAGGGGRAPGGGTAKGRSLAGGGERDGADRRLARVAGVDRGTDQWRAGDLSLAAGEKTGRGRDARTLPARRAREGPSGVRERA